jgi:hypothetical protein
MKERRSLRPLILQSLCCILTRRSQIKMVRELRPLSGCYPAVKNVPCLYSKLNLSEGTAGVTLKANKIPPILGLSRISP